MLKKTFSQTERSNSSDLAAPAKCHEKKICTSCEPNIVIPSRIAKRFVCASITIAPPPPSIAFIYFFELIDFHKARIICSRASGGPRECDARSANICEKCVARNVVIKRETYFAHRRMFDRRCEYCPITFE